MAHDIFVSYAHIDDQPPEGLEEGWITYFAGELNKLVAIKLGRYPDVWMDYLLPKNVQVNATLNEKIRDSKTIVLFMSPSYLNSKWCEQEIGDFLAINRARNNKESVFIVAVEKTKRENWHQRLQELTPLELYRESRSGTVQRLGYPRPPFDRQDEYWTKLNELAHLIKNQLELINDIHGNDIDVAADAAQSDKKIPTVWIAQPTADLHSHWEHLASSIRQRGAKILPLGHSTYPLDVNDLRIAIESDLTRSDLLIQLLSPESGDVAKILELQALAAKMRATTADVAFLQWRLENIDLLAITDSKHRELLQGTIACGFEQFRQQVLEKLDKLINPKSKEPINKQDQNTLALCVSAGQKDSKLAKEIEGLLAELNHVPIPIPPVPEKDETIEKYNADLRSLLEDVDGVILAYSQESLMWLHGQHAKVRKALAQRPSPWGAFVDGPPSERQKISWNDPGIMYLDCRNGLSLEPIQRFIDTLQREA